MKKKFVNEIIRKSNKLFKDLNAKKEFDAF